MTPRRTTGAALAALCLVATPGIARAQLAGDWDGYWARAGDTMAVTLRVTQDAASGGYRATFDADRLRVSGIPFSEVRVDGCCDVTLVLRGDRTTATFGGRLRGDTLSGVFTETDEGDGTFAYRRAAPVPPIFDERDVTFRSGDVTLAGTLLVPRYGHGLVGVVFVHGSGAEGRWASRFLATHAAERGIAALIFDKRGVGQSTGDWQTASLDDLAGDAAAAVAALRQDPGVIDELVGIHGHSQGGTLAPLFAARIPDLGFIVASAAAGVPTDSTEIYSILSFVLPQATSAADSALARDYVGALVDVAYNGHPRARLDAAAAHSSTRPWYFPPPATENAYWTFSPIFAEYEALEWWAQVRVPVMLVYGADDERVPAAESAARISGTLLRAGNGDVAVRIFPDADHTFRLPPGPGGWPRTAPGYVETLIEWLGRWNPVR